MFLLLTTKAVLLFFSIWAVWSLLSAFQLTGIKNIAHSPEEPGSGQWRQSWVVRRKCHYSLILPKKGKRKKESSGILPPVYAQVHITEWNLCFQVFMADFCRHCPHTLRKPKIFFLCYGDPLGKFFNLKIPMPSLMWNFRGSFIGRDYMGSWRFLLSPPLTFSSHQETKKQKHSAWPTEAPIRTCSF